MKHRHWTKEDFGGKERKGGKEQAGTYVGSTE